MPPNIGPYSKGVLTRIYNLKWGGLAVIFGKEDTDAPPFEPTLTMVEDADA